MTDPRNNSEGRARTSAAGDDAGEDKRLNEAWAEALAEQAGEANTETQRVSTTAEDASDDTADDWAAALAEQQAAALPEEPPASAAQGSTHPQPVSRPMHDSSRDGALDLDVLMNVPVTLAVQLGSTRLSIRELLDLGNGSTVELDELAAEPMDVLVNGFPVARGEVVVVDDSYGIRITEVTDPADRLKKLAR